MRAFPMLEGEPVTYDPLEWSHEMRDRQTTEDHEQEDDE